MKAVLMSIKPKWCEKIFSGEKTVEVRKVAPKLEPPFKVYVYETIGKRTSCRRCVIWQSWLDCPMRSPFGCTEGTGAVVGEFVCDEKHNIQFTGASYMINNDISLTNGIARQSCLYFDDMFSYLGVKGGAALHITAPKRYDTPKELGEFYTLGNCEKYDFCNQCKNFHRGQGWLDGSYYDEDCCLDNTRIPVTRAPQSWQYVEEMPETSVMQNDKQR